MASATAAASKTSTMAGVAPAASILAAPAGVRLVPVTPWPASTSIRVSGRPIAPLAPARKTRATPRARSGRGRHLRVTPDLEAVGHGVVRSGSAAVGRLRDRVLDLASGLIDLAARGLGRFVDLAANGVHRLIRLGLDCEPTADECPGDRQGRRVDRQVLYAADVLDTPETADGGDDAPRRRDEDLSATEHDLDVERRAFGGQRGIAQVEDAAAVPELERAAPQVRGRAVIVERAEDRARDDVVGRLGGIGADPASCLECRNCAGDHADDPADDDEPQDPREHGVLLLGRPTTAPDLSAYSLRPLKSASVARKEVLRLEAEQVACAAQVERDVTSMDGAAEACLRVEACQEIGRRLRRIRVRRHDVDHMGPREIAFEG